MLAATVCAAGSSSRGIRPAWASGLPLALWLPWSAAPYSTAGDGRLADMSLREAAQALVNGKATSADLVDACAARVEAGASLNAFVTVALEGAREGAKASDARRAGGRSLGPLDGVPLAVKDNFCTLGELTTAGSRTLGAFRAPYESTATARLKAAGALVMGKTGMDEFGMGSFSATGATGPVVNPWRDTEGGGERTAGGSSGGSAAAVAAGMAYGALGSDTGGSVRLPAAYTGCFGLKPSYGRVSRHGLVAYASSTDCPGLLTKSAADAGLLLALMQGEDARDPTSMVADAALDEFLNLGPRGAMAAAGGGNHLEGLRVGVPDECHVEELEPSAREAWAAAARWLREAGAEVVRVRLPTTKSALAAYYVLAPAEASSNLARYDGVRYGHRADPVPGRGLKAEYAATRAEGFGPEVQRRVLLGAFALSSERAARYYRRAQQVRRLVAEDFASVFRRVDLLLTPTAPAVAPLLASARALPPASAFATDVMTVPASLAGLPAASVPAGLSAREGLPVGVQLVGPRGSEARLLRAAEAVEAAAGAWDGVGGGDGDGGLLPRSTRRSAMLHA